MNIVIFEVEDWEREAFQSLAEDHNLEITSESLTAENAQQYADANVISTFIYSQLDEKTLSKFHDLKLIATRSTGYDHIDTELCQQRGIEVSIVPDYGAHTVAEHAFGLLLTISHRLNEAIERPRKGDFSPRGLQGFDLYGKTLGVIGTGNIGRHMIRIAKGFGMPVLAFDVKPDQQAARQIGFDYVSMEMLLAEADVISLHVPANSNTYHLIGEEEFKQMKDGVVLLNTARGSLIDEKAMVRALSDAKLAGAGLDVLPQEPVIREEAELLRSVYEAENPLDSLLAGQVLIRMRNVVVTPHSAFNTREAVQRIVDTTAENIQSFVDGEPQNTVELKLASEVS